MSEPIVAFPMYDWPERRAEVDAEWAAMRAALHAHGVQAPSALSRRNADMPAVPGGIRDKSGKVLAPDPATLDPDGFDLPLLWRHPDLLLAQTCWGPLETTDLSEHVVVVGQPDYSRYEGGRGHRYSSAIAVRMEEADASAGRSGHQLPLAAMRGRRLAFNDLNSMTGFVGLERDLDQAGESMAIFSEKIETGSHRASIRAVAEGTADICAIDCRSWHIARKHEPAARLLAVIGWTSLRPGLPWVTSKRNPPDLINRIQAALSSLAGTS